MALQEIGTLPGCALFHCAGIAAFKDGDFHQTLRSRCGKKRFINVFKMNVEQTERHEYTKHGCSTNIRDTRFDPVPAAPSLELPSTAREDESVEDDEKKTERERSMSGEDEATSKIVRASRKERFDRWFTRRSFFLRENRCYLSGLARVLKQARDEGVHCGEWSARNMSMYHPDCVESYKEELCEWQATVKLASLFACFGEIDERSGRLYMSRDALESIYLDSRFPNGYKIRSWGVESSLRVVAKMSEFDLKFAKVVNVEIFGHGSTSTTGRTTGGGSTSGSNGKDNTVDNMDSNSKISTTRMTRKINATSTTADTDTTTNSEEREPGEEDALNPSSSSSSSPCPNSTHSNTTFSDMKFTYKFVSMMQSKGVDFLKEISEERIGAALVSTRRRSDGGDGSSRKSKSRKSNGDENDIEKGDLNFNQFSDYETSADEGRLSLASLDSLDDLVPLIE